MKKTLILVLYLFASTIFAANYKMVRSKSYVNFFIKSMVSNVNGKFKSFQVTKFNKNKDSVSGKLVVDVSSIDTQNAKRDKHLRQRDFLYVEKYPNAIIQVKKVYESSSQHYADLSITIRGITRSKKAEVRIKEDKDFYQASGNVVINRKKFGVTYGVFYNPISDNATVSFKINMAKQVFQ